MDDNIFDQVGTEIDKIHEVDLKKTMEKSYIDYAMSVIVARAIPDIRDGLKPVQRRVLYSMIELNNGPDKPHRKCARIVGDTMGKYHPHGDSSIYGALVCLAQNWATRYPLVDGHGNFGSVDGDGAAAMRYTEARLSKISMEMLADINKDTVNFIPNFDETEKEPTVLPSRYPNLLANGTTGIAVGMATNIPPHNLGEIIDACVKMIENKVEEDRETSIDEIINIIKGPDFPTGATILGRRGIEEAYRTGRGKIRVRAVTDVEAMASGKTRIIVTELPFMVNKARLIEKIAELVKDKKIDGITELRDESNREGMRICIELRKDINANIMLNLLYKHTQLQDTFGVNMLALVNNEPKVLNLEEMVRYYLIHQEDVVKRRTKYDLNKAEERAHILEGLMIALDNIDRVITIIRGSANVAEAKEKLITEFALTDVQAQAIVDMRLRALTGLERAKLEAEYNELMNKIAYFKGLLADKKKLLMVIKEELQFIKEKYADKRRTTIGFDEDDIDMEDLIDKESVVITRTNLGYIKRMSLENFRSQARGGKGIKGMQTIEEDFIQDLFMTSTHDYLMFFTNKGRVYRIKCYEIPEASRIARGTAIVNLLQLQPEETIAAVIPMDEYDEDSYVMMATKSGIVKKTAISEFKNIRKTGLAAITIREEDELVEVVITNGSNKVYLATQKGQGICFHESQIRATGRTSMGVRGIDLKNEDHIIGMQIDKDSDTLLFVTDRGMGKRTLMSDFKVQSRGGKGVRCYKLSEKTGLLVGFKDVQDDSEILLITDEGIIIRMSVDSISKIGRDTSGVRVMNLADGVSLAGLAKVKFLEEEETIEENEEEHKE